MFREQISMLNTDPILIKHTTRAQSEIIDNFNAGQKTEPKKEAGNATK